MQHEELKSKTIRGIAWKGMERIAAQLVSAIVGIILARILTADDYSVVSIVAIFFSFCSVFISGGLNSALIQKKDADETDYSTILVANLFMATVLYGVMYWTAPMIAGLYNKELLRPVIRVMALMFFINGYKSVVCAKITSELRFKSFFFATIIGTIISAFVGILMALSGCGAWALVAQQMTNGFVDAVILGFASQTRFKGGFSADRFKKLFSFGGKIMLSSIINEVYNQIRPLVVGLRFSRVDLAYYNKGKTYPELISRTGNDTLSATLFPAMSKVQDDKEAVLRITRRFMQMSSYFVFPTMLGFFAVSEGFVRILLTDKWLPIVPYVMIFCVTYMFEPIQTGNLQAIRAIGRSDVFLKLEIIKKTLYLLVIALFLIFANTPIWIAVSSIITTLLASLINTYPNRKLIGYGYIKQLQDLLPNLLTAVVMGGLVFAMKFLPIGIKLVTVLQVLSGVVIYVLLNYVTRNKSQIYLIGMIKDYVNKRKHDDKGGTPLS